jgi:predicted RNA-binding Zn ribbon-like protein
MMYAQPELRARIRLCENPKCAGLFLDGSRAGIRRWCSMRTCGAAAKKRAYRARTKMAV